MADQGSARRPIGRRILCEDIREQLIEDILKGDLAPGARLVETRIAQEFGVSQAPVREALRDLELLGFVVKSSFRGTRVRQISHEDLTEIYPIRAALEAVAARAAATRMDEPALARLDELLGAMRDAARSGDGRAEVEADVAFHHFIVEASGNGHLHRFWEGMRLATTTFLSATMSDRSLLDLAERHVPILDALRAHNPAAAEDAMRRHIEEAGEWIRAAIQQGVVHAGREDALPEEVTRKLRGAYGS